MKRILIFGNSGSGKTALAAEMAAELGVAVLDLDTIAWQPDRPGQRLPFTETERRLQAFTSDNPQWIIEGCYGDLLELLVEDATELVFLDPGVDACIANNQRRPWEPHKYATSAEQAAHFDYLQAWVSDYYIRTDEFSHARQTGIFESYPGPKHRRT